MFGFSGEYDCKVDSKGRLMMPAKLVKQLPKGNAEQLVVNSGMETCLTLYTEDGWRKVMQDMSSLNDYEPEHRKLRRLFLNGATEVALDSTNRLMIPKRLAQGANITKEVVVVGQINKIEIWDKALYEAEMNVSAEDFAQLAKAHLGKSPQPGDDH